MPRRHTCAALPRLDCVHVDSVETAADIPDLAVRPKQNLPQENKRSRSENAVDLKTTPSSAVSSSRYTKKNRYYLRAEKNAAAR